jgi:large subunit ribosomal protein L19
MRPGRVRRAKLYYIREKIGKSAKIKELITKKAVKTVKEVHAGAEPAEAQGAAQN